ncbi:MAG: cupredoxin domain-containing protein [Chloroflexi bacterium]|nr:cupredoxin domain-containing protein [Chloroflexota bacterium]MDA1271540.1 cupredoxin domain-containing protein [Chloroflexota bacterium]
MNLKKTRLIALTLFVGMLAMVAAAACGSGSEPEDVDIPVTIKDGKMSPATIKVKQNDTITLKIDADVPGEFHLHTYDIESDIHGDEITDFVFVADATGRFRITYHPASEKVGHGSLFQSEELAPGETFTYLVDDHLSSETVPFHSHLRPALAGSIIVSQPAGQVATAAIAYNDDEVEPHEVIVGPGTVITWTNNSSVPQTVISGLHADMAMDGHGGEDEHGDGETEIDLGFMEVQPR